MSPKDAVTNEQCDHRVERIHEKLDRIADAVARIEERQHSQGGFLGHIAAVVAATVTAFFTTKLTK